MSNLKILAVDDNAVNLATIEQVLQDEYDVIPMTAGKRALRYLGKEKADLVLLDFQMPVMNGIETLEEIRKLDNGWEIPVVFLTALNDDNIVEDGKRLGIKDCIKKPFDKEDLKDRIRSILEGLVSE